LDKQEVEFGAYLHGEVEGLELFEALEIWRNLEYEVVGKIQVLENVEPTNIVGDLFDSIILQLQARERGKVADAVWDALNPVEGEVDLLDSLQISTEV
jgi:hypothetical protein